MKTLHASLLALAVSGLFSAESAAQQNMVGTWLRNGSDKTTKFVFSKDGSFAFFGPNAKSKGRWKSDGAKVQLVWTQIDADKVAPGKVKGSFPLTDDGALKINTYQYRRRG